MPPKYSTGGEPSGYDIVKVQNFLCVESFLAIHENKEEDSADLHAKIFAEYCQKVRAFLVNKRECEGYKDGMHYAA